MAPAPSATTDGLALEGQRHVGSHVAIREEVGKCRHFLGEGLGQASYRERM